MASLYRFKSLNTRLNVLLLIPVFLLLITGGVLTFMYTRNLMLNQWNESAVLKLARAAHGIEMRLTAPVNLLNALFGKNSGFSGTGDDLVSLLKNFDGVLDAQFIPEPSRKEQGRQMGMGGRGASMGMRFHRSSLAEVSNPVYDAAAGGKTVTMAIELMDKDRKHLGTLKMQMGFDYLLEDAVRQGWWHSYKACLVTKEGIYLAHADKTMAGREIMGETGDLLEKAIVKKIAAAPFGTVAGKERPPEMIAGFYTLKPVPWVVVLYGRGKVVLRPIILYLNLFVLSSIVMVALILLMIRAHTGRVVREIRTVSRMACEVAQGRYGNPVPVAGRDEISQLVTSYNTMVEGLKERDFIRDSFGRYVDPEFAKQLMERPDKGKLGGERRQVVILMSDLRGFTPLAESLSPEVIIEVLNQYFSEMIQIIQSCRGIIVDFFGDAVLVFFDPLDTPVSAAASQAMACAFAMQDSMAGVNQAMASKGLPDLFMGIGVHAGPVVVGNIGSSARAKYGIVGSAVNITSRIQARAKKGEILVSSDLLGHLPGLRISRSFEAELKGIRSPMTLNCVIRS